MKSMFARHYSWMATMLFATVLSMGIAFITLANGYITTQMQGQLIQTARNSAEAASAYMENFGILNNLYKITISTVAQVQGSHILAVDRYGVVIMCSDDIMCRRHINRVIPEAFMDAVFAEGEYFGNDTLGIYEDSRRVAACAVTNASGSDFIGYITVSMAASDNSMLTVALLRICLLVAGVVLAAASVSAYLVSMQLTKPLKAISNATQRFAQGDFSARVPVDSDAHSEVNTLCANFNAMADSLWHLENLRRDFIANVSHELRTPMTVISGYVDGLLDGAIPRDDADKYLSIVGEESRRLSRLVASMLDITQLQSGKIKYSPQPVNVCEVVRRVILGFEKRVEDKALNVTCDLPPEDVSVIFDPDALTQLLTGLTDNAVKFAPADGMLSISVAYKGHRGTVSVTNSGPEIPEADLPFIFDRFHKADKSRGEDREGLGLGLYIVRSIVSSHNETISVTSAERLTTFTFTVKIAPKKANG